MRAIVFHGARDLRVEEVPDPKIEHPTDAVVRVTHACVCGTDLWFYRGIQDYQEGWRCGHEFMGVVEEVGGEVRGVERGDAVIAPFIFCDNTCEFCRKGLNSSCVNGAPWAGAKYDGGQGEAVRVPLADGTLVKVPEEVSGDEAVLKAILPLTDVMGTGHHAALSAGVREGGTAAVVGDGAVGLCAVLAARRLGAERIIMLGHHEDRLKIAEKFGATDLVRSRGEQAVNEVTEITRGGAKAVMECVGTRESMDDSIAMARPGGTVGYVGVPHNDHTMDRWTMFVNNIGVRGGMAPVRAYIPELLEDVLSGSLDSSSVFDYEVDLDGVPEGYAAMDGRRAIKTMIRV
ncbi:MAG: zinc-dependent alcohol dehydrogenase family protein [Rubrobacteraceae bacterium]